MFSYTMRTNFIALESTWWMNLSDTGKTFYGKEMSYIISLETYSILCRMDVHSCNPRSITFDLIKLGNFKLEEKTLACRPVPGARASVGFSQNWREIGLQGNLVAKIAKHFGHRI